MGKVEQKAQKVVVISGKSSGLGSSLAEIFEKNNFVVIGLSRTKTDDLSYVCDVTDFSQVDKAINDIALKYGKIDVLINNAGYGVSGATELICNEEIKREYDVNILGCINCYKSALKYMPKGSKIINISSACALFPLPYRSLYCSSKAGLHQLSLSLNMECKPLGVEVISVCPGDIKTNFTKNRVKVFETNDRYKDRIQNATLAIDSREDKRMDVSIPTKKIYKIATRKKNKPFVIIGAKYKLLYFAMRFLPKSVLLQYTEKFFGGHKKKEYK